MRNLLIPAGALLLLGGCGASPPNANRAVSYVPSWTPPPSFYDAPPPVDQPRYVPQTARSPVAYALPAPDPGPVPPPIAPVPQALPGDCRGWWRICHAPGWYYEN